MSLAPENPSASRFSPTSSAIEWPGIFLSYWLTPAAITYHLLPVQLPGQARASQCADSYLSADREHARLPQGTVYRSGCSTGTSRCIQHGDARPVPVRPDPCTIDAVLTLRGLQNAWQVRSNPTQDMPMPVPRNVNLCSCVPPQAGVPDTTTSRATTTPRSIGVRSNKQVAELRIRKRRTERCHRIRPS